MAGREQEPLRADQRFQWEVQLGPNWVMYDLDTEQKIADAVTAGESSVTYIARGFRYIIDLRSMQQINQRTGARRPVRRREVFEQEREAPSPAVARSKRVNDLVDHLLSSAVQVPLPRSITEEPARLRADEVEKIFVDHVPGVQNFLYRDMPGKLSLDFVKAAYFTGIRAFHGTDLHQHLLSLMRIIVHYADEGRPESSRHLQEVAEAFQDCQAVQARVVERIGLEILGVQSDFRGLVTRLIGDYKALAVKMLACEHILQRKVVDDGNPTHYENRLVLDLGDDLGLNQVDVRRAAFDEHARKRYVHLKGATKQTALARCRELFDIEALQKALATELCSLSASAPAESLPRQFVAWAADAMHEKHIVFDETTCTRVDVDDSFVLAMLETLYLGRPAAPAGEMYRSVRLHDIFEASRANTSCADACSAVQEQASTGRRRRKPGARTRPA
eukprot:TRINITY_DN9872_c1_g1_i1.p1 TRINITY_DN9872_c1_g1~~TRINITY_DN9872_c1_g1_i1.p1  ORF type:complete len:447 (-),score=80.84 TRINITY_DN9872_c1_g1_i1:242-1582(-)